MKKILLMFSIYYLILMPVFAQNNKITEEYLKNKKHFSVMNPIVENIAEKAIKTKLKKDLGKGRYRVKFDGYSLGSMKCGVFKNLEVIGKNFKINDIEVPYLKLKNETDYNWIDFSEKTVRIKSNIVFNYDLELTEKSVNSALKQKDFEKNIEKINQKAFPLFALKEVTIRIHNDKVFMIMDYFLPISGDKKIRKFVVSSKFKVDNGKILADSININTSYGNIPIAKVANLINLLDPLTFTLIKINEQNCKSQIENVIINDDIIKINGKIFIKGE